MDKKIWCKCTPILQNMSIHDNFISEQCDSIIHLLTTRHCTTLHYTTLHHTTLHYTTLHYTSLHYTALHYTTLYYTTLHYTILYYTTLYYTTMHHTTPHHRYITCHRLSHQLKMMMRHSLYLLKKKATLSCFCLVRHQQHPKPRSLSLSLHPSLSPDWPYWLLKQFQ